MKSVRRTIYCHTNRVSGKRYVGQTVDTMEGRWREHLSAAKANRGSPALGAAIRKYGADVFDHRVLEIVSTQDEVDLAETRWIAQLSSRSPDGYNIASGGGGPGYHHEDTKRRISAAASERLKQMAPEEREAYFQKNIHMWTAERKAEARALVQSTSFRAKVSDGQKRFWAQFTPEEKSARVLHQISGLSAEQKSARVRKAWAAMTPEMRAERIRKTREANVAADGARSKKMSAWQTAQAKLRTPEQRSAIVRKAWVTRRARAAARGAVT